MKCADCPIHYPEAWRGPTRRRCDPCRARYKVEQRRLARAQRAATEAARTFARL